MADSSAYSIPVILIFLVQLLLSSALIGLSGPASLVRLAGLPLVSLCVYYILVVSSSQMRFHWVGLLGGVCFVQYLQFIDLALLSGWSYETHAHADQDETNSKSAIRDGSKTRTPQHEATSVWQCCMFGWNSMWSLRHVNTKYEVRNVPHFSKDPTYVPGRWTFVARRALAATICYLVVDVIDSQPPPPSRDMFSPSMIPMLFRLREVTAEQLIVRFATLVAFSLALYCTIQGFYSLVAAIAVGSGLSEVESWRPLYGSLTEAYTVRNVWGKFWHQCIRHMVTTPASEISRNVLRLHKGSLADMYVTTFIAFQISGVMHCAAAAAGGRPWLERHVLQFFATQTFGLLLERAVQNVCKAIGKRHWVSSPPTLFRRSLGYVWVVLFMTWSTAVWVYPPASRPPPEGDFVPFSLVKYMQTKYR